MDRRSTTARRNRSGHRGSSIRSSAPPASTPCAHGSGVWIARPRPTRSAACPQRPTWCSAAFTRSPRQDRCWRPRWVAVSSGRTPAAQGESSSSGGRKSSCGTSRRGSAGSTSTPSRWRMRARPGGVRHPQRSEQGPHHQSRDRSRAHHRGPRRRGPRVLAMSESTLGVGIIGVSPVRGWAATAHIPALRALPNYEIRALSARSAESARAAGEVFGVSAVFSDHEQMVTQSDIDVVAVTVKVPHHRELVSAALAAGKAVYCEWPLGRDLDDARAMAALAAEQRVRTVVGLQGRQAREVEFVQALLREGYVGEVLSTTMVGLSIPGGSVGQPNAYMLDKTNGANVLTIAFG